MRMFAIAILCGVTGACVSSMAPSVIQAWTPQHHNIPATFAGHPEGRIIYLCATQLRSYGTSNGKKLATLEEDHYLQYEQCPVMPIR